MVGYHVHEKAIMTAIIPMTLLATTDCTMAHVYIRTCTFGIFGILPLLYQPEELLVKVTLYIGWSCMTVCILEMIHLDNDDSIDHPTKRRSDKSTTTTPLTRRTLLTNIDHVSFILLACILLFMEIIHPLIFMPTGRMEFLPLLLTSVTCAIGLVGCWLESYKQMMYAGSIIQHEY
jgi:alpha-1,3-glucosyltransferase